MRTPCPTGWPVWSCWPVLWPCCAAVWCAWWRFSTRCCVDPSRSRFASSSTATFPVCSVTWPVMPPSLSARDWPLSCSLPRFSHPPWHRWWESVWFPWNEWYKFNWWIFVLGYANYSKSFFSSWFWCIISIPWRWAPISVQRAPAFWRRLPVEAGSSWRVRCRLHFVICSSTLAVFCCSIPYPSRASPFKWPESWAIPRQNIAGLLCFISWLCKFE